MTAEGANRRPSPTPSPFQGEGAARRSDLRLLFITQELDASSTNLGVAHLWAEHLARQVAALHVVAARTGVIALPSNVTVHALGKEAGAGRWQRWLRLSLTCRALLRGRHVDGVLAHMVPAYALAAIPWARGRGTPVVLWYTSHGRSRALRWAHRFIAAAATASPESYPPGGAKAFVLGHGVDTLRFAPAAGRQARNDPPVIGAAGRLTPLKGFEEIIRSVALLHQFGPVRPRVRIAGGPFYASDRAYAESLRHLAVAAGLEGQVEFLGALPAPAMPDFYRSLDVFVNWRTKPALDKTGLEALASGTALVTNNTAYAGLFGSMTKDFLVASTPEDLARGLGAVLSLHPGLRAAAVQQLRHATVQRHSADGLAARLVGLFEALRGGAAPPFESLAGLDSPA